MRRRHFIDAHKGATAFVVLALIAAYGAWDNEAAWVYLGLHGGYGFLWLLKGRYFPDAQWDRPCSLGIGVCIWLALGLYWIAPWLIVAGDVQPPGWFLAACVLVFVFGVFFHFVSDMQKAVTLRLRPGELITTGLFARLRNPNYFGELLVYVGFSALAMSWIPMLIIIGFVGGMWVPNMLRKDRSLSRYPNFATYRHHSKLFIPGIW